MDVRLPDGTLIRGVPDGTTKADLTAKLKANGMAVPSEWLDQASQPSVAERVGGALMEIPRQVGLTARYGLEGAGQLFDIGTEPLRQLVVNPIADLVGARTRADQSTGQLASGLADRLGLPTPQDANERVVGDATRAVASGAGIAGLSRAAASGTAGAAQNVFRQLAARPGVQLAGAASAGGSGGAVREAGGGPLAQFGAALAGGVAGGAAAAGATRAVDATVRATRNLLTPRAEQIRAADQEITLVLGRSGIDWSKVPDNIKAGLRNEVADALSSGKPLNADALRRLVAFRQTGTTPTVGMLTQDPGVITREMNLAKTGANSMDPALQRLPQLQNSNVRQLLTQLDDAGARTAPDAAGAGKVAIQALRGREARARSTIDRLYQSARDTQGRSLPLERSAFTRRANELLDQEMVGGALPGDVAKTMNRIAKGEMPFTVEIAEQLKTRIGKLQRASNDGTARMALGLVRQALDETPLQPNVATNPRNLPAVPGTVPPSPMKVGQESIDAFNKARGANRAWMQRVESNPALKAVVDGVEPDQFVQRFVVGKGASAADVRALRKELSPGAMEALKQYLVRHLRDAATNSTDDIAKFSNDAYRRAMRDIGDDKLAAFFSADELSKLKAVGEAGKYMQAQPAGSAVNNSNSGALVLGRGVDMLERAAAYAPLGLDRVITGRLQGAQQTQLLNPRNAITAAALPAERGVPVNPLLAAAVARPEDKRKDNGRR